MDAHSTGIRLVPAIVARPKGTMLFLVRARSDAPSLPDEENPDVVVQIAYSEAQAVAALRELGARRREIRRVRARLALNDATEPPRSPDPRLLEPVRITGELAGAIFALYGRHAVEKRWDESGLVPAEVFPDAAGFVYGRAVRDDGMAIGLIDADGNLCLVVVRSRDGFSETLRGLFLAEPGDVGYGGTDSFADAVDGTEAFPPLPFVRYGPVFDWEADRLPARSGDAGRQNRLVRGFPAFLVCELLRLEAGVAPELPPGMRPPIPYVPAEWARGAEYNLGLRYRALARENLLLVENNGKTERNPFDD